MAIVFASGTQTDVPNVLAARIAANNQTSMEFNVPSGVYKIEMIFDALSNNSGSPIGCQVGDSVSFKTSGYEYVSNYLHSNTGSTRYTGGFITRWEDSDARRTGCMTLWNTTGNIWVAEHTWGNINSVGGTVGCSVGGGRTDLGSSVLTRVRFISENLSSTFDGGYGQVNLFYE